MLDISNQSIVAEQGYIQRIHACYDKMSVAEKKIADYIINSELADIANMTVNKIADNTSTSPATVVRFCRTIGFDSFSEFRFSLQKLPQGIKNNDDLLKNQNASAIKDRVVELVQSAVSSTVFAMDNAQLEEAINLVSEARTILIWGKGTASGIALATTSSFVNMGIHAVTYTDELTARRSIAFLNESDLIIVINRNGEFQAGINLCEAAKKRNIKTIAITEIKDSRLAGAADVVLLTAMNYRSLPIMLPSITLCQQLTIQLLQVGVLLRKYDELKDVIDSMYNVY